MHVTRPGHGGRRRTHPMGHHPRPAPAMRLSARYLPCRAGHADGLQRLSGRTPRRRGGHPINHHVAGPKPADPGKPGCPSPHPQPSPAGHSPPQEGTASTPDPGSMSTPVSLPPASCPGRLMIRSRPAASRAPPAPPSGRSAPHDPATRSQNLAAIRGRDHSEACPILVPNPADTKKRPYCASGPMQVSRRGCIGSRERPG